MICEERTQLQIHKRSSVMRLRAPGLLKSFNEILSVILCIICNSKLYFCIHFYIQPILIFFLSTFWIKDKCSLNRPKLKKRVFTVMHWNNRFKAFICRGACFRWQFSTLVASYKMKNKRRIWCPLHCKLRF